jgi:hypothetical protein
MVVVVAMVRGRERGGGEGGEVEGGREREGERERW